MISTCYYLQDRDDWSCVEYSFSRCDDGRDILGAASIAVDPGEDAFGDPTVGMDSEANLALRLADDPDNDALSYGSRNRSTRAEHGEW